jgi:tRNA-dihydrouridine synthase A
MLGLRNGQAGSRRWRQVWSEPRYKQGPPTVAQAEARAQMNATAARANQPLPFALEQPTAGVGA